MAPVEQIIAYETGELSEADTLALFSSLIADGSVWVLQGHYGRTAVQLIDAGIIDAGGKISEQHPTASHEVG